MLLYERMVQETDAGGWQAEAMMRSDRIHSRMVIQPRQTAVPAETAHRV